MFKTIDWSNSVVVLCSDHGASSGPGPEPANPLMVMMLPPNLLTPRQRATMRSNEQSLTTHFDAHLTLRLGILDKFADQSKLDFGSMVSSYCHEPSGCLLSCCASYGRKGYGNNDNQSVAGMLGYGYGLEQEEPWQFNLFDQRVENDTHPRNCKEARSTGPFCFCSSSYNNTKS